MPNHCFITLGCGHQSPQPILNNGSTTRWLRCVEAGVPCEVTTYSLVSGSVDCYYGAPTAAGNQQAGFSLRRSSHPRAVKERFKPSTLHRIVARSSTDPDEHHRSVKSPPTIFRRRPDVRTVRPVAFVGLAWSQTDSPRVVHALGRLSAQVRITAVASSRTKKRGCDES